jgi:hypothetical protein
MGEGLIYAGLKENHIVLVRKAPPPGVIYLHHTNIGAGASKKGNSHCWTVHHSKQEC